MPLCPGFKKKATGECAIVPRLSKNDNSYRRKCHCAQAFLKLQLHENMPLCPGLAKMTTATGKCAIVPRLSKMPTATGKCGIVPSLFKITATGEGATVPRLF